MIFNTHAHVRTGFGGWAVLEQRETEQRTAGEKQEKNTALCNDTKTERTAGNETAKKSHSNRAELQRASLKKPQIKLLHPLNLG
jgi:hypothetical protein